MSQKCPENLIGKPPNLTIPKITRKVSITSSKPKSKKQFSNGKKSSKTTPRKVKDIRDFFERNKTDKNSEKEPPDKLICGPAQQLKWGEGNFNPNDRNVDPTSVRNDEHASSPAYTADHLVKKEGGELNL